MMQEIVFPLAVRMEAHIANGAAVDSQGAWDQLLTERTRATLTPQPHVATP